MPIRASALLKRALPFASLAVLAWLPLDGCKSVYFGPTTPTATNTDTSNYAFLSIKNLKETDPGTLTFYLYDTAAASIQDAIAADTVGKVDTGKTLVAKVPAGTWKVGYATETGDLHFMPVDSTEASGENWAKATFAKGESYKLTISTDAGNVTAWSFDFPVSR